MSSIKDLSAEIRAIDATAETKGLNHDALTALLDVVKSEVPSAPAPPPPGTVAVETSPFSVAAGKSLLTKRGILADGDAISAGDLHSVDIFKQFVKSGYIVKN